MSDRYRDQIRNREDCVQKLQELAAASLVPRRRKTKPSFSPEAAQESKARHSENGCVAVTVANSHPIEYRRIPGPRLVNVFTLESNTFEIGAALLQRIANI